jgi:hypothetical protein
MNMKNKWLLALPLTLMLVFGMTPAVVSAQAKVDAKKSPVCLSPALVQLKAEMQKGWIDHTIRTRSYIVSAISNR